MGAGPKRVTVVGAGLGGLSAACYLAGAGHEVTVVEREAIPGGRAGQWSAEGFRFDTGPTVLTMTGLLSDVFKAAGAEMSDHLDLTALDPTYRAVFADGSTIRCRPGVDAMRNEIREVCGSHDADAFVKFCAWLEQLYNTEMPHFIDRNFNRPTDMLRPAKPIVDLLRLGGLRKLSAVVESYFDDPRLHRLFSFQAMYAGLSPYEALAIYAVITYMDSVCGVYFPKGGIHSVSAGLASAAAAAGAEFRYNTTVDHVVVRGPSGAATGVRTADGETISADVVVLNPDLPIAYRDLLPDTNAPRVARKGKYSPSCVLWLAGVQGALPADASHHNIHFGAQWRGAFEALGDQGRPMPDPSILVTSPSHTDPELTPPGHHSLYVLEPVPNLDGNVNWEREGEAIRKRLVDHVSTLGYSTDVVLERFIDPPEWQRMGMERGAPFALSHLFRQTGPFRPSNVNKQVPGVVFTGSGTVPGVGVPMVLVSGKLAAQRVDEIST